MSTSLDKEGSFVFSHVTPGRYGFFYVRQANPYELFRQDNTAALGTADISADLTGLQLRPLPPTGFSGVVKLEMRQPPRQFRLSVESEGGEVFSWDSVEAPGYGFKITNLVAGTFDVSVGVPKAFVKAIRKGDELVSPRRFTFSEGVVEEVEILVSEEMGRISGTVKAAPAGAGVAARKGAQFQVGLSRRDKRTIRSMQADQNGRFEFNDIPPGDYRICAWADLDQQSVYDEKVWEKAGRAAREFTVEAGAEVEIDLTALP
jgi:hypothetical protein